VLIAAGTETTANACAHAVFHVLTNPHVKERLKKELVEAWPDVEAPISLERFEKLPYLVRRTLVLPSRATTSDPHCGTVGSRSRSPSVLPWRHRRFTSRRSRGHGDRRCGRAERCTLFLHLYRQKPNLKRWTPDNRTYGSNLRPSQRRYIPRPTHLQARAMDRKGIQ
jgi:hypothetical protein